jgi:hypothetical protein
MINRIMILALLLGTLKADAQQQWAGNWEIPMQFSKNFPEKKKPDYWCRFYIKESKEAAEGFSWKSDVHHGRPVWSFEGHARGEGDTLYMYALDYVDHRPRKERQVNEEKDPAKPFYILFRKGDAYMLKRLQGKPEEAVEIKKMN